MVKITPSTASVAHGGSTQQFLSSDPFVEWSVGPETDSKIDSKGLLTSGINTGTVYVTATRYDGGQGTATVTIT